jgi:hypothetical protein
MKCPKCQAENRDTLSSASPAEGRFSLIWYVQNHPNKPIVKFCEEANIWVKSTLCSGR